MSGALVNTSPEDLPGLLAGPPRKSAQMRPMELAGGLYYADYC